MSRIKNIQNLKNNKIVKADKKVSKTSEIPNSSFIKTSLVKQQELPKEL